MKPPTLLKSTFYWCPEKKTLTDINNYSRTLQPGYKPEPREDNKTHIISHLAKCDPHMMDFIKRRHIKKVITFTILTHTA